MIRTSFVSSLVTCTILLEIVSGNGRYDHWNYMNEIMSQHLNKYTSLFQPHQELMFDEDGEDRQDPSRTQKLPLHGFMTQFTDLASIVLNTETHRKKQREKFRKYSGESLPEDGVKSTDELMESQRLSALEQEIEENRNGVEFDQNDAQKLHERFLKKHADNYLGHFRPVEYLIPREEFEDEHIRRLLQEENPEVSTVSENPEELAEKKNDDVSQPEESDNQQVSQPPSDQSKDEKKVSDNVSEDQAPQDENNDNQNHGESLHEDHPPVQEGHDSQADHPPINANEHHDDGHKQQNDTQNLAENQKQDNSTNLKVEEKQEKPDTSKQNATNKNETKKDEKKKEPVVTADDTPKEYAPNMNPNVQPKVEIYYVDETYPVKDDPRLGCKNDAKYVEITQLYYFCFLNSAPNNVIRVNNQSYIYLTTLPYYTSRATCYMAEKTHDACYCSAGYTGALCQYQDATKCYVNVTSPKLYEGCQDEYEDSEYYMYSIQGFDPCHFFDFNEKTDIKFQLKCLPLTKKGIVKENGHTEKLGLEYVDVIKQTTPSERFNYAAINQETKMRVSKDDSVMFSFDFRDWKYLTNIKKFRVNVTDAQVIAGLKEGSVTVDFKELVDSDEKQGTKFEVAGRVYWEASVSGLGYQSFVTTGFFDRKGYEEPQKAVSQMNYMLEVVLPIGAGILIVIGLVIYKIVQRNKKISAENEQLALMIERQKKQAKKNKNKK